MLSFSWHGLSAVLTCRLCWNQFTECHPISLIYWRSFSLHRNRIVCTEHFIHIIWCCNESTTPLLKREIGFRLEHCPLSDFCYSSAYSLLLASTVRRACFLAAIAVYWIFCWLFRIVRCVISVVGCPSPAAHCPLLPQMLQFIWCPLTAALRPITSYCVAFLILHQISQYYSTALSLFHRCFSVCDLQLNFQNGS